MYAGGVLKRVNGLTYDKLTYFVRAGYVKPKKIKKKSLLYNDYSQEDLELIKRVWELISKHDIKTKTAFKSAGEEVEDLQLTLNLGTPSKNSDL